MLKVVLGTIRRFPLAGVFMLAMLFAAPGFDSQACENERADIVASAEVAFSTADDCVDCLDCGPVCGCSHAPHSGMAADLAPSFHRVEFARDATWTHELGGPMSGPAGPERPPRI